MIQDSGFRIQDSGNTHWALGLLGRPYRLGAAGPEAFDCWGLVRHVQAAHYGRELPVIAAATLRDQVREFLGHPEHERWREVSTPHAGDVVQMGHVRYPWHAGVWLATDGGGVLHAMEGAGVVFQGLAALRASGWGRLTFWRFAG